MESPMSDGPPALVPCPMSRISPMGSMEPPPPPSGKKTIWQGPGTVRRGPHSGDVSASESSAILEDTETDDFQAKLPNLERFYEQMAAKARLPTHPPGNVDKANWVLSLARSYRRLSNQKRSRGRMQALLAARPAGDLAEASALEGACGLAPGALPLQRPKTVTEGPGWSSDSGYEAGYETDADESELSEWEGARGPARHGHKRKLDALVQLTMRMSVVQNREQASEAQDAALAEAAAQGLPPMKAFRSFGTKPVGLRFSLPHTPPAAGSFSNASWGMASGVGSAGAEFAFGSAAASPDSSAGQSVLYPEPMQVVPASSSSAAAAACSQPIAHGASLAARSVYQAWAPCASAASHEAPTLAAPQRLVQQRTSPPADSSVMNMEVC